MSSRLTGDFRKFMDKNYLGSWDVPDGEDLVLTIDHVEQNDVKNERGSERKLTIHFAERGYKPMILNTTNAKRIGKVAGSNKVENWENLRIAIYTEKVTAFGGTTDALRIREYAPRETEAFCDECGQKITRHGEYSVNKIVQLSKAKYKKCLCWDCSIKAKEEADNE
jgi:hypothetical protein